MDKDIIADEEILYRLNRESYPDSWINGKPTAALFMDPKGLSIQRDGGRDEQLIIDICIKKFKKHDPLNGIVKVIAAECRRIKTYPKAKNNVRDIYHGEIHNSEDDNDKEITLAKAIMLAEFCNVVLYE